MIPIIRKDRKYIMNNLRQTTLPFRPTSSSRLKADAHSSSPSNTSKGSTPKDTSSSHSSHSAPVSDERERLRQLAKDTLSTLRRGVYISPSGKSVHIKPVVEACLKGTLFYPPDAWNNWENTVRTGTPYATRFSIREVTTLESAQSLVIESRKITPTGDSNTSSSKPPSVGILNFASATKPGGGFKNGAIAQEESIARVSSLYFSLTTPTGLQFYKKDVRESEGAAYSHAMIYSPRVIVFNNDGNTFLEEPYEVSVVTSPAVNAGTVRQRNQDKDPAKVERAIARIVCIHMSTHYPSLQMSPNPMTDDRAYGPNTRPV